jgi:hypothetical protein
VTLLPENVIYRGMLAFLDHRYEDAREAWRRAGEDPGRGSLHCGPRGFQGRGNERWSARAHPGADPKLLAGIDKLQLDPKTSALLVMEFQTAIRDAHRTDKEAFLARTADLVDAARSVEMKVIYVVVGSAPDARRSAPGRRASPSSAGADFVQGSAASESAMRFSHTFIPPSHRSPAKSS